MIKLGKIALWILGGLFSVSLVSVAINPQPVATPIAPEAIEAVQTAPSADVEPVVVETVPVVEQPPATTVAPTTTAAPTVAEPEPAATTPTTTVDTYTNVDGNEVQSPTYYDSAPAGASAQCRDGSYSFSQHRSGTCSHHGGVAEWL